MTRAQKGNYIKVLAVVAKSDMQSVMYLRTPTPGRLRKRRGRLDKCSRSAKEKHDIRLVLFLAKSSLGGG